MIDVLEQMVADGKYREAIKLAEQILSNGVETPAQLVAVQSALVAAHCRLGEWEAALAPGEAALALAQEIGDWDAYGKTAMFVSTAYSRLGQEETAVARTYDFIAHLGQYHDAASFETLAWFNLGGSFLKLGRPADAAESFKRGLAVASRRGDHRNAHGLRHALIGAALKAHDHEQIPRLLAQSLAYLLQNPEGPKVQESWLHHLRLRAEYALATGRSQRAAAVALRGLERAHGALDYACWFHVVLAQVAAERNSPSEGFGHALAAQALARTSGRPDLESAASEVMYQISHAFPDAVGKVDQYYLG